jgi:WD40 repeat protein
MRFPIPVSVRCLLMALGVVAWSPHALAQQAADVRTSVVKVTSKAEGEQQRTAAGFVVRVDSGSAYIVTASHVVEGDPHPQVSFFAEPNRLVPTKIVGVDAKDPKGLAVLLASSDVPPDTRALSLDTASDYRGGTPAVVIGFPLTRGTGWSVIPASIDGLRGRDLILTAPLEAGDSGAPIMVAGKVIGVVGETRGDFGFGVPAVIVQLTLQGWNVFRPATTTAGERAPEEKPDSGEDVVVRPKVTVDTQMFNEPMEVLAMAVSGSALLIGGHEFHKADGWFGRPSLTLWDLSSGRLLSSVIPDKEVWNFGERIEHLALSRDGSRAIIDGSQDFMLYDTRRGVVIREFSIEKEREAGRRNSISKHSDCWGQNWDAISLALSADGKRALSSDDGCMLRLWDADTGKAIWAEAALGLIEAVAFSPDERLVLSGGKSGWDEKDDTAKYSGYPNLRDAQTGRLIRSFKADSPEIAETVSVTFSPDGRFVVSHTRPKGIVLWDVASGKLLRVLIYQAELGDDRYVYSLRFSPDGRYLIAGCFVHDLHSGRTAKMLEDVPCDGPVASLPGGNYALYGGYGVQIYEFTTRKHVASLITLGDGQWMTITSENYYVASPAGEKRLIVEAGGSKLPIDGFRSTYGKADEVRRALAPLLKKP